MNEFLKILLSLSISGTLLTLLLLTLKKLYKNRCSKRWQYYIWLAAVFRFLIPFTPGQTLANDLFHSAEAAISDSIADIFQQTSESNGFTNQNSLQTNSRTAGSVKTEFSQNRDGLTDSEDTFRLNSGETSQDSADIFHPGNGRTTAGSDDAPYSEDAFRLNHPGIMPGSADPQLSDSPPDAVHSQLSSRQKASVLLAGLTDWLDHFQEVSAFIFCAWLIPAISLFIHKARTYRNFVHAIRTKGSVVSDRHMIDLLAACKDQCGIQRPVELYLYPQASVPVMTGFFHPCIAITHDNMNDTALSFIFRHELLHYKRLDLFYKWLIQAAVCIHWFNPVIRLLRKEAGRACELACDEAVIHTLTREEKIAYGDTLILCSKMNSVPSIPASSLNLTEGAKQLKERLGEIMNERKHTKKTAAATAILTAIICFSSIMAGVCAVPVNSASIPEQNPEQNHPKTRSGSPSSVQSLTEKHSDENSSGSYLSDDILSKYKSLLAFKTDSYQNMTADSFREQAVLALDTPKGMKLLSEASREESIRFYRFTDQNAFFLCNILLPLTSEVWKTTHLTSAAAERPLKNGQTAELEFRAEIKILNPDIKIYEYEYAYRGLHRAASDYLSAQTEAFLMDTSPASVKKAEQQAQKALKQFARTINKSGNLLLSIDKCMYAPEDYTRSIQSVSAANKSGVTKIASGSTADDVKKVLSLKTAGYQEYNLKDFSDYISQRYENDRSVWKAKERLAHADNSVLKTLLTDEDYYFITVTLPCTQAESTDPHDRTGNIPPDFGARFQLPYPKHKTITSFEWAVRYEPSDPDLTVGQRDQIIINVLQGMEKFVENTSESADTGSMQYLKKLRKCLDGLLSENKDQGLNMTVFQCMSDGKSA